MVFQKVEELMVQMRDVSKALKVVSEILIVVNKRLDELERKAGK